LGFRLGKKCKGKILATIQRKERKSGVTYTAVVRIHGFPTQSKTFARKTDAKSWAEKTEQAIKDSEFHNVGSTSRKKTVVDIIIRYRAEVLPNKAETTQRAESTPLKFWEAEVGTYSLSLLKPEKISQILDELAQAGDSRHSDESTKPKKPKSRKTIKHYRDMLDLLFKCAIRWGWTRTNPVDGVERITRIKNERTRYLSDSERAALLQACKASHAPTLYPFVVFALSTGARKGEIEKLKISDIDTNRNVAVLRDTKNGDTRVIPLTKHAREVIEVQIDHATALYADLPDEAKHLWLFPRADGQKPFDIRKAWEKARSQAKLVDFRFHDLRHSTASYLAMHGANQLEIAEVLGHRTLQMVKRYAHLSDSHVKDLMESVNEKVFENEE